MTALLVMALFAGKHPCLVSLDALEVPYEQGPAKPGIELPVTVTGPIAGVTYKTWTKKPLVLDCSLVYSLAVAGHYFTESGFDEAFYSSSYQRRNVRGTNHPSRHSYGLAIDIHELGGPHDTDRLTVSDDYEQGLGDDLDCIGLPLTPGGMRLRILYCRMARSDLFRLILTPDYDQDHYNHFHVEALPWKERVDAPRKRP